MRRASRILLVAAWAALEVPLAGSAAAQAPVETPGRRVSPFTIVLDSVDLRRGRGNTLAGFLAGRVPGLLITAPTGPATGMPSVLGTSTSGSFPRPEPWLYVDGVLMRDDPNWFPILDLDPGPSLGWGLPVDEIEEIEVHIGPAGAGALEFGAARGAVLVTTRRPLAGARRTWGSVQATSVPLTTSYEANHGRLGITSTGQTNLCRRADEVLGTCTGVVDLAWSPMAEFKPLQSAEGYRAHVGTMGSVGRWAYVASALDDGMEGIVPSNRSHRTDLALSVSRTASTRFDLTVDARYARIGWKRGGWTPYGLNITAFNYGPLASDSIRALFPISGAEERARSPGRLTDRFTIGATGRVRLGPETDIELRWSADELGRHSHVYQGLVDFGLFGVQTVNSVDTLDISNRSLAIDLRHGIALRPSLRLEGRAGFLQSRSDFDERRATAIEPGGYGSADQGWVILDAFDLHLAGRLAVADRGDLSASIREEALNFTGQSWTLKSVDGQWELLRPAGGRSRLGLTRLTARAAYGESIDHRSPVAQFGQSFFVASWMERTTQRQVGLDARWRERLEVGIARTHTTVRDGAFLREDFFPNPAVPVPYAGWRITGTQFRVAMHSAAAAPMAWRLAFDAAERLSRVTELKSPDAFFSNGSFLVTLIAQGAGPADLWARPYTYDDVNDDGVIVPSEVVPGVGLYSYGSTEPRWVFTFNAGADLRSGLGFGVVVESRLGQVAHDLVGESRCRRSLCDALYDYDASLADQAAAIAADSHFLSAGFIKRASFARLREVYVAYPLPGRFGLRLTGHNLLILTQFPGQDPEELRMVGAIRQGSNNGAWPMQPALSLRLDVGR